MSVWVRRGMWGLAGLLAVLAVLAAVAAWLVSSFDANQYKGVAIDWMKTNRNRTLAIDGPIELSVFPRLAVKVSKVRLSEVGKPDPFVELDNAGLAVDLLPLLRGKLVIDRVQAKGVRAIYRRDAKGKANVDDMIKPGPPQPASEQTLRFDISGIDLSDVHARVKDETNGVDGELVLKSFTTGRLADKVESPVKLNAQFDFKSPAVKGALDGETRLTLATESRSVSLRDMSLAFKGDVPGASAVDAVLKGSLAWDGAKGAVEAKSLDLKLAANAGGLKLSGTSVAVDRFAFDAASKSLALRKLEARVKGTQAGHPLTLELDWPELSVAGNTLGGGPFSGKLTRGGDLPIDATFKSTAPRGGFDAVQLPGFEAQLKSVTAQRKVQGTLRSDLTLKPALPSLAFDKLDLQATVEEPKAPPLALSLQGNALASTQRSTWTLSGRLNTNTFSSDGVATLAGATPHVVAKARFDGLDLNRLMPASAAVAPKPADSTTDTPVDLAGLRSVNGQFSVQAGHFAFKQYRVDDIRIDATLDGGMLRMTQLHGKTWGGLVDATAMADARAGRVAVKGTASGVNVNALLKDVAAKDWMEGTGKVAIDVDTAGRSVNEMKSHLKGNAALQLRDGAVKGINLAKTFRDAKSVLAGGQDTTRKSNPVEKTDFSELSATFQIADGVARNKDLDAKSPFLRLGGEGAINVGKGRIDYVARATVASTTKGQDGADLSALKGVTVPVRLSGPFESMDWKIEWSSVVAGALAKQVEDKLSQRLGLKPGAGGASGPSPQEAIRNKLKGLFK